MQPVMSVADVRELEKSLIERGVSELTLMRRAGGIVAIQAAHMVEGGSVVVMCGPGNNGGDGWVCADDLLRHGYDVCVVTRVAPEEIPQGTAGHMAMRAAKRGVPVLVDPDEEVLAELLAMADVVVDACFGIGFHGLLPEPYATWARCVDEGFAGNVLSVDVPSGVDATTGMTQGAYFTADMTVTMFATKPGLMSGVGRLASGTIVVAGLSADEQDVEAISDSAVGFVLEDRDYVGVFPDPDPLQDKFTHGRVLVVAGSTRFPGAAILAALAAARSGVGYVTLAVPEPVVPIAQSHLLTIPVVGLAAAPDGSFSAEAAAQVANLACHADVVLAGPGMTTSDGAREVMGTLLGCEVGLVCDADALNCISLICGGSACDNPQVLRREASLVLTPHRRELARLAGVEAQEVDSLSSAMGLAQELAWAVGSSNLAVLAKGPETAVVTVDSALIVHPGPSALATAGTGDVLAGVCAGHLAQVSVLLEEGEQLGSSDLMLTLAGADRVHAIAGDLASRVHGSRGVIASDVVEQIGQALDELLDRAERDYSEYQAREDVEQEEEYQEEVDATSVPKARADLHAAASARSVEVADDELEEPSGPADAPRRRVVVVNDADYAGELGGTGTRGMAQDLDLDEGAYDGDEDEALLGGEFSDADKTTVLEPVVPAEGEATSIAAEGGEPEDEDSGEPADLSGTDETQPQPEEGEADESGDAAQSAEEDAPDFEDEQADNAGASEDDGEEGASEEDAAEEDSEELPEEQGGPSGVAHAASGDGTSQSHRPSGVSAPSIEGALPPFLVRAARAGAVNTSAVTSALTSWPEDAPVVCDDDFDEAEEDEESLGDAERVDKDSAAQSSGDEAASEAADEARTPSPLEEFHKKATRHAGVTPRVAPQDRPSASKRSRGNAGKRRKGR